MYIPGHESIINDVLSRLPQNQLDNEQIGQLKTGLFYPDLPCGKYTRIPPNKVFLTSKTTCSFLNLLKLYDPKNNEFYEIFQSHKGILAYLHSMSPSPSYTARDVRTAILHQALVFFLLALYDDNVFDSVPSIKPSYFWIGMLLHMVMDSYSPAHTIRKETPEFVLPPRSIYTPSRLMRKRVRDVILDTIRADLDKTVKDIEDFTQDLQNTFDGDTSSQEYIKSHSEQIYNSYLMFMFDQQTTSKMKSIIGTSKPKEHSTYEDGNITNFMYYNNQFNFYHQKKDFLYNLNQKTYDIMINDCVFILTLFFDACSANNIRFVTKYLKKILNYLTDNTFRMTKRHLDGQTGQLDMS